MKFRHSFLLIALFCCATTDVFSQNKMDLFLKPSDTLSKQRIRAVAISEGIVAAAAISGLNSLWYSDYPKTHFHFINDNAEWLQMDKAGHVYSSYLIGNYSASLLRWGGADKKSQLLYGSGLGFVFLTTVEVLDGYSSQWGASWGDVIANAVGTGMYVSQELIWNEQRIVPKYSFHTTQYAALRPSVLGNSLNEQMLKDYNGQTYWISVNAHSFFKNSNIPQWLNLAFGYGANGMITGNTNTIYAPSFSEERVRQFYVSLDVDLTKIKTKSHLLKTLFFVFNSVKVPAPTIEFVQNDQVKLHFIYF